MILIGKFNDYVAVFNVGIIEHAWVELGFSAYG